MADKKIKSPNGSPKPATGKSFTMPKTQAGKTNASGDKAKAKIPATGRGGGKC